ncbi:hypothetical protein HYU93_00540 [Candidatus Daviesbacteria bacterium]|nr:hypothetical protein [Candidatus Daviesbacteria bacterium]
MYLLKAMRPGMLTGMANVPELLRVQVVVGLARVVASWVVELRPNVMNKHQVRVVVIQVVK